MKRLMGIMLVLLMLLTCICGCNSANVNSEVDVEDKVVTSTDVSVSYGTYPEETYEDIVTSQDDVGNLDFETIKKIKKDYLEHTGENISLKSVILIYYGTLSDGSMVVKMDKIGDIKITGFRICIDSIAEKYLYTYMSDEGSKLIYKNEKFFTIKKAYDNEIVSNNVIDEYFKRFPEDNHTNSIIRCDDDFGDLSLEESANIKYNYISYLSMQSGLKNNKEYEKYSTIKPIEIKVKNCGTLSENLIFKFEIDKKIDKPMVFNEKIAEYNYNYELGHEVKIYIIKHKMMSTIKNAYINKGITENDLDELFKKMPELQ